MKKEKNKVTAYKGFDKDLACRGYEYRVGETYEHDGKVEACESGFHACHNPLDVFGYYSPGKCRFAEVELSGDTHSDNHGDSKIAAAKITIIAEISIPEYIKKAIQWVTDKCEKSGSNHATGYRSASSATGDRSASSATGDSSASSATGDSSASSATGDRSASSATGYSSASSATGYSSASSATGYSSASSATGDSSASSATGYSSASSATGDSSASLTIGSFSKSEIIPSENGECLHASAIATGYKSKARAPKGCALFLVERSHDHEIVSVWAGIVGDGGIKENVFYMLADGSPVEANGDDK